MSRSIFLGDLRNGKNKDASKFSGSPSVPLPTPSVRVVRADGEEAPEVIVSMANAKAKGNGVKKKCCGG